MPSSMDSLSLSINRAKLSFSCNLSKVLLVLRKLAYLQFRLPVFGLFSGIFTLHPWLTSEFILVRHPGVRPNSRPDQEKQSLGKVYVLQYVNPSVSVLCISKVYEVSEDVWEPSRCSGVSCWVGGVNYRW